MLDGDHPVLLHALQQGLALFDRVEVSFNSRVLAVSEGGRNEVVEDSEGHRAVGALDPIATVPPPLVHLVCWVRHP